MNPRLVTRTSTRCPGRKLRFFLSSAFAALISLYSVIVPLRRFLKVLRLSGHFLPLQRSSALAPFGARWTTSRTIASWFPRSAQVALTRDVMRFGGGGGGAAISTGCAWVAWLPAASVAVTVTLNAPAEPNACDTAPPDAVDPSPKFQAIATGETRSVAAAAIPMGAPTFAPGGTLELSAGAAASKLAVWKRK